MKTKCAYFETRKCKRCGKKFIPAPLHAYKEGSKYYCSWTCYNHRKDRPIDTHKSLANYEEEIAYESN